MYLNVVLFPKHATEWPATYKRTPTPGGTDVRAPVLKQKYPPWILIRIFHVSLTDKAGESGAALTEVGGEGREAPLPPSLGT